MPIYEYECRACGHRMEKIQKMADAPLKDCPACEKPELSKLISAAAFRLKGGGWYETDFKSGDKKKNLAGDDNKPKAVKKTETKKSDGKATKPAAKSE